MQKRTCLVTGGTSGVGLAIATSLADRGERVIITSRSREHGEQAAHAIAAKAGSATVQSMALDLSDLAAVARFAAEFQDRFGSLHLLSLNAGLVSFRPATTSSGCSLVTAVNYLGHFHLTTLLTDLLVQSAPARVISVIGNAIVVKRLKVDIDSLCEKNRVGPIREALVAAALKTMFTFEFARRLSGTGVTANAFHPGGVKSRLGSGLPFPLNLAARLANIVMSSRCPTGEYLASSPEVEGSTGGFYESSRQVEFDFKHHSPDDWARLWENSERIVEQGRSMAGKF